MGGSSEIKAKVGQDVVGALASQASQAQCTRLWNALRCAQKLINSFNSYSTGCSCLAEEDVAQLFGEYTEALEAAESTQEVVEQAIQDTQPGAPMASIGDAGDKRSEGHGLDTSSKDRSKGPCFRCGRTITNHDCQFVD